MNYRPEIDGLRAIAVISVILSHINLLEGGFLGVDIFFVISGYLITGIILADLNKRQFSFANFYERRARRILPALSIVVLASIPAAWLLMSPPQLKSFGMSLISVMLFVSNFLFCNNVNYFSDPADLIPLLHTWSLGVEEQFYIIFPLLFLSLYKFLPKYLLHVLVLLIIASLLLAQILSTKSSAIDFYYLPTRFWELMCGAILAKIEFQHTKRQIKYFTSIMPVIGLCLLIFSITYFDKNTLHPGFASLVPVIATMCIIWFCGKNDYVTKLLSYAPLVGIGLISYSLYLWHQPVLSYLRLYNQQPISALTTTLGLLLVFGLSYITWLYIEKPFRDRNVISRRTLVLFIIISTILIISCGVLFYKHNGYDQRFKIPRTVMLSINQDASNAQCNYSHFKNKKNAQWFCTLGKQLKNTPDYFVTGDSHALAMTGAFKVVTQATNMQAIASSYPGCSPLLGIKTNNLRTDDEAVCNELKNKVFHYIQEKQIKNIILIARWDYFTLPNRYVTNIEAGGFAKNIEEKIKNFTAALNNTIETYNSIGVKVIVISQVPLQNYTAFDVYKNLYNKPLWSRHKYLREASVSRRDHEKHQQLMLDIFKHLPHKNYNFIDITDITCDKSRCPLGTLKSSYYHDTQHLSKDGSEKYGQRLTKRIKRLM